jgi:hypothetical protein
MSDFKKLVLESTVFVDKSLLINDFLTDSGKTVLITFPRKFGKSINVDMIKKFLSLEVNANGERLHEQDRENRKLFLGGEIKLEDGSKQILNELKIAKHTDIMEYQGRFPVIHVDFKDTQGDSYEEVLCKVKTALHKSFLEHEYLSESSELEEYEKKEFSQYINVDEHHKLPGNLVNTWLYDLSRLLSKRFGCRSYILMDEYDAAINNPNNKLSDKESKKVMHLFQKLNEMTFKGNDYLKKGLITGVLSITDYLPNNLRKFSMLDYTYFEHFGFTQQEVEYLFNRYEVPEILAKEIKHWCNGYKLGEMQSYNPFSIVKCLTNFEEHKNTQEDAHTLKTAILKSYWADAGCMDFMNDLLRVSDVKSIIDQLVRDEPLYFNLQEKFWSKDLNKIRKLIDSGSNDQMNGNETDILFSYLFHAGYLTNALGHNSFKFINDEVKTEFQNKFQSRT